MGKNLIQQRRGRGGMNYRSPSHRHVGEIKLPLATLKSGKIIVVKGCFIHRSFLVHDDQTTELDGFRLV